MCLIWKFVIYHSRTRYLVSNLWCQKWFPYGNLIWVWLIKGIAIFVWAKKWLNFNPCPPRWMNPENTSHLRATNRPTQAIYIISLPLRPPKFPGLSMSFLTVQALRFAISGILPNQEGSHPWPGKTFRIFGSQKTGCCVESARAASKVAG